jgi:hypothetical protein
VRADLESELRQEQSTRDSLRRAQGFGRRDYLRDFIAEVQHQLGSKMSVTAGCNRNWTDNPTGPGISVSNGITGNLLVTPADYSHFCVVPPDPARSGADQISGYDLL